MKITAIVPSAGSGSRMYSKTDKPFIKLKGRELILYALKALERSNLIDDVIIPASGKNVPKLKKLISKSGLKKVRKIIKGGKTRAESVFNALCEVSADTDYVLVHDCARPFLTSSLIAKTVNAAKEYSASLAAVAVKPTIKESDPKGAFVKKTLTRSLLWEAQTPQVFKKKILLQAYKKAGKRASRFTDDTSLVENLGKRVKIVKGNYDNIKITTREDLKIAESIL